MPGDAPPRPDAPVREDGDDDVLELVDESGRTVGAAPRSACHSDPELAHRAVHVLVRNSAGAVFLQKRARTKRIQPGRWDSSVGGHLARGESYERAAARELLEELGVRAGDARDLRRLHDYIWRSAVETEHVRTFELAHEGPFEVDRQEIEEGRFWTPEELRAAAGTGALTPNLEEELRRVGVLNE